MATREQVKREIDRQYAILERACARNCRTDRLLYDATQAAREHEKQHRRGSLFGVAKAKQSVETAAKYYVLQAFRSPATAINILEAASLRLDVLYGSALRACLEQLDCEPNYGIGVAGNVLHDIADGSFEVEYLNDIA